MLYVQKRMYVNVRYFGADNGHPNRELSCVLCCPTKSMLSEWLVGVCRVTCDDVYGRSCQKWTS